jgi:hypothetical protein
MNKILILVSSILLVTCCANYPTIEQLAIADYGTPISQSKCEADAVRSIKSKLKDPYSAKFEHGPCREGYRWDNWPPHKNHEYGFVHIGSVNAKNAFGAYRGMTEFRVFFQEGKVKDACIQPCATHKKFLLR